MKQARILSSLVVVLFALVPIAAKSYYPSFPFSSGETKDSPMLVTDTGDLQNTFLASSCLADLLTLGEDVLCHPASPYIEIRFNLWDIPVPGTIIFEVSVHAEWIGNIWMENTGTLLVHRSLVGDTISVSQFGVPDCSRDFVVPACTEQVCPLDGVLAAAAVDCQGDMAHFRLVLAHASPIDIPSTDFGVYDETGEFITIMSAWAGDSIVDLFVPVSLFEREYSLCDLFQYPSCCIDFTLPAVSCDSLPVRTEELDIPDIRLYPNPVSDRLLIKVGDTPGMDGTLSYRIFQATGTIVSSGIIERNPATVDMAALPAGIYLVGVWQGNTALGSQRVVKVW